MKTLLFLIKDLNGNAFEIETIYKRVTGTKSFRILENICFVSEANKISLFCKQREYRQLTSINKTPAG